MITFHGGKKSVWTAIKSRSGKKTPITAAIAYLSKADALPFKAGDVVIANLSKRSVSTGATNPAAALELLEDGVEVRTHPNLHAKVIVTGEHLFVGSMNASGRSSGKLVEAVLETTNRQARSAAGRWLMQLSEASRKITRTELRQLAKLYKPSKGTDGDGSGEETAAAPETAGGKRAAKTWLVAQIPSDTESEEADEILDQGPSEKRFAGYEVNSLDFPASWRNPVKVGDLCVFAHREDRQTDVWPAAEVWDIKEIDGLCFIFYAYPSSDEKRTLSWSEFREFAKIRGFTKFRTGTDKLIPAAAAARIIEEWPRK